MVNSRPSVFLFIGDDVYSKEKAIRELAASFIDGPSAGLDYKVFYGGQANASEVLDHIATIPFLSAKRLVVIKEFEKFPQKDRERIACYIKNPSKSTHLVLESSDDSILKEYDSLAGHINIKRFEPLTQSGLLSWIRKFLSSNGKKIEEDALKVLREAGGRQDLLSLTHELEKLTTFVGRRTTIKLSDVEDLIGKPLTASAFDIGRAIEEKRLNDAVKITSDLILTGKRHHEIIGVLGWYFKRILKAKILKEKGESDSGIAYALKINRSYYDDFFKQVRTTDINRILSNLHTLLDADLDIKRTRFNPTLVLESALVKLCIGG